MPALTQQQWDEVRCAYLETSETVRNIATRYGISSWDLSRRARAQGWPRRAPPRSVPAKKPFAATTIQVRRRLVRRLFRILESKLELMEQRMQTQLEDPEKADMVPAAERERDARAVATLVRSLDKVTEIAADLDHTAGGKPGSASADELFAEADRFRRELAERLSKFIPPGAAFTAEVRGLAHYLQQPKGRLFQYACDADLGDARCTVDLDDPAFRGIGIVADASSQRLFTATGLDTFEADWFTRGLVTFTSGANTGRAQEVKRHAAGDPATIELWQPMAQPIAPGDVFTITAGCDKHFATCRAKFDNGVNFRGFPHMPGNDFITAVARPGDPANDGASRQ